MNEEEKKAIEIVQGLKVYYDDDCLLDEEELEENKTVNNAIDTVINLIEKQQKELEDVFYYKNAMIDELTQSVEKLKIELAQEKASNKFDKGLYGLYIKEKEKNKELERNNIDLKEKNRLIAENLSRSYISKDKIKEIYNILGEYRHYTTPTIEQNEENENAVDNAVKYIHNLLEEK